MKFLPYIYSCANTSHTNGVLMKPLAYMYPEDENTYQIYDEYIFGNSFLVAPVLSESSSREIYLPEGKWHDYNDLNRHFEGPATIIKESDLLTIPVFVKENSIFVTGDVFRSNSRNWLGDLPGEGNLTIHLVPGEENESTQFTYLDYFASDNENVMKLIHRNNKIIFTCGMLTADVSVEILLKTKPLRVLINSRPVDFDFNNSIVKIKLAPNTETVLDVEIK